MIDEIISNKILKDPPQLFSPCYTWVWNCPVKRDRIDEALTSMSMRGIKALYILPEPKRFRPTTMKTTLEPDYPSAEFFSLVKYTYEKAKSLGMLMWLYDEGGWPSGSVCGELVRQYPECAAKVIAREKITLKAGKKFDGAVSAYVDNKRVGLPYTAQTDVELTFYRIKRENRPNLLDPDCTRRFIELTHAAYKNALGEDFVHAFVCAFTDEPSVPYPSYLNDPKKFQAEYGYSIDDNLPVLFDDDETDSESTRVRIDYCDFYSREVAENYYGVIRSWCRENGILSAGHLNGDDDSCAYRTHGGHLLRQLSMMDIPGVDAIWRQISPDGRDNGFFPRFASSAARQNGGKYSLTESFAVYGAGLTYSEMRSVAAKQAVEGISLINPMVISLGNDRFTASQERPCFQNEMPGAKDLAVWNEWAARLSFIASYGEPAHKAALYYPIRDVWASKKCANEAINSFKRIGSALEGMGSAFDIADNDFLRSAQLERGELSKGLACYDTIYIPECKYMPEDIYKKLLEFESQGGKLFFDIAITDPPVKITPPSTALRVQKRIGSDATIYLCYNESAEEVCTTLEFNESAQGYEYELLSGNLYKVEKSFKATISASDIRVFIFTDTMLNITERKNQAELIGEITEYTIKPLCKFTITPDGVKSIKSDCAAVKASSGDFAEYLGGDFSGDALYEFTIPPRESDIIIDFGEVKHSCELFIGEKSLGTRIISPYTYEIESGSAVEASLRVSNTAANAYVHTDIDAMFEQCEIGPYHSRTLQFEQNAVGGGLYGHVKIYNITKDK